MEAAIAAEPVQARTLTVVPPPGPGDGTEVAIMTAWTGQPVRTTVDRSALPDAPAIRGQIPLFAA